MSAMVDWIHPSSITFFDWERWPAVVSRTLVAFAVLAPGEGWSPVSFAEVIESGLRLDEREFATAFPHVPPFPDAIA